MNIKKYRTSVGKIKATLVKMEVLLQVFLHSSDEHQ